MRRHTLLLGETSSCPPPNSPTHCKLGSWDRWSNASSSFSRGMRWKARVSICDITFRKTPFHLRHSLFTLAFWLRLAKKRLRKADMHMIIISNSHFDKMWRKRKCEQWSRVGLCGSKRPRSAARLRAPVPWRTYHEKCASFINWNA